MPPGSAMCYGNHITSHSWKTVQLVSVSFSHISLLLCLLSHCMDDSLFAPFLLNRQKVSSTHKWLRSTKRDWDGGWSRVEEEDRGRSVREGTKATPSDCRWLFHSLTWIWAFAETSAGLFAGDTANTVIEWMMMLKWRFHFSLTPDDLEFLKFLIYTSQKRCHDTKRSCRRKLPVNTLRRKKET